MSRRVAFVTGASRGIGRAASLALAERGFDVVVTARTLVEGETADGRPLPGSLATTAAAVRRLGREALPIHLDLLEPASIDAAVARALAEWGHVDVLVNNAIYTGPGSLTRFLDVGPEVVETMFRANVFAQIELTRLVLPGMLARGAGCLINLVSGAGLSDPPAAAGRGGWGYVYAATKAAFHRMVGVLAVEHEGSGLRFLNVEPGFVMTEAMRLNDPEGALSQHFRPAPPEVPGRVIAWLADEAEADAWNGKTVFAQPFALERGLHPDWRD